MSDLIRRSDAIWTIWGDDINPSEDGMVFEAQSHIDRGIRLIPSADRPQGWIPCSERLPKEYGRYIVATKIFGETQVEVNIWDDEEQRWSWVGQVIAWQPTPQPYREGE